MKLKFSLGLSALVAVGLTLVASASALACEPRSETDPRCVMPIPKPRVVGRVVPTPVPLPQPTPVKVAQAATNRGLSPADALPIDGSWQIIPPNAFMWYRVDNGTNFYSTVYLDSKEHKELGLSAFSPEQQNELAPALQPKGRGSPSKDDTSHDLVWKGTHTEGVWHIMVSNRNSFSVEHKLTTQQASGDRQCRGFDEIDRFGKWIHWVDCGMYGLNK